MRNDKLQERIFIVFLILFLAGLSYVAYKVNSEYRIHVLKEGIKQAIEETQKK